MAAWGLTGLLGAALGAATGRRVGRVPLALFCGAMGLLFGAIMDFSTLASYGGEHSLDRYLAISGTALPFNVAHAVGNVAFCLAFGPALVRALERFRARLHITWIPLEATRP
jgi:energy-coupling factor transport system substrate-specific component